MNIFCLFYAFMQLCLYYHLNVLEGLKFVFFPKIFCNHLNENIILDHKKVRLKTYGVFRSFLIVIRIGRELLVLVRWWSGSDERSWIIKNSRKTKCTVLMNSRLNPKNFTLLLYISWLRFCIFEWNSDKLSGGTFFIF
jgi:hypothetical protein